MGSEPLEQRLPGIECPGFMIATNTAAANVDSFQRRVTGDLPIQVEIPHTGNFYRFVRPLVIDAATKVMFEHKRKQPAATLHLRRPERLLTIEPLIYHLS